MSAHDGAFDGGAEPNQGVRKILVAMVGPLAAAIVGTLIIGPFVAWITDAIDKAYAEHQAVEVKAFEA